MIDDTLIQYLLLRIDVLIAIDVLLLITQWFLIVTGRRLRRDNAQFLRIAEAFKTIMAPEAPMRAPPKKWMVRKR
jgi:hypothetical protein